MKSVVTVFDPHDELELSGRPAEVANLAAGRIHCPVPVDPTGLEGLSIAILTGLGKRTTAHDLGRSAPFKWQMAQAWLQGETVRDVIVSGAENLAGRISSSLPDLAQQDQRRLWLIYAQPSSERHFSQLDSEPLAPKEFLHYWRTTPVAPKPEPAARYPRVPREEFARFRLACHRELATAEFKIVNPQPGERPTGRSSKRSAKPRSLTKNPWRRSSREGSRPAATSTRPSSSPAPARRPSSSPGT